MNEMATRAPHIQGTGECVGAAILTVLRRLIFKNYNKVHAENSIAFKQYSRLSKEISPAGLPSLVSTKPSKVYATSVYLDTGRNPCLPPQAAIPIRSGYQNVCCRGLSGLAKVYSEDQPTKKCEEDF